MCGNKITSIPAWMPHLSKLHYLDLGFNKILDLPSVDEHTSRAQSVTQHALLGLVVQSALNNCAQSAVRMQLSPAREALFLRTARAAFSLIFVW